MLLKKSVYLNLVIIQPDLLLGAFDAIWSNLRLPMKKILSIAVLGDRLISFDNGQTKVRISTENTYEHIFQHF